MSYLSDVANIVNTALGALKPNLASQASQAASQSEPPIKVVPDGQMPRYGEEAPRKNWQQNVGDILGSLDVHRATHPVYSPFPAGTPTLQAKQLEQQKEESLYPYTMGPTPAQMMPYEYPTATAALNSTGTKNDYEADLEGLKEYYASANDYKASIKRNAAQIIRAIGKSGYNQILKEADDLETGGTSWSRKYSIKGDPIKTYFQNLGG